MYLATMSIQCIGMSSEIYLIDVQLNVGMS